MLPSVSWRSCAISPAKNDLSRSSLTRLLLHSAIRTEDVILHPLTRIHLIFASFEA